MFRKAAHILFAIALLVSTIGITFSMHYCGGKLVSTSIIKETKSCCDGMGGCCENKTVHFEVKDDFIGPLQLDQIKIVAHDVLFPLPLIFNAESYCKNLHSFSVKQYALPPPKIQTSLAILQSYLC